MVIIFHKIFKLDIIMFLINEKKNISLLTLILFGRWIKYINYSHKKYRILRTIINYKNNSCTEIEKEIDIIILQ